MHFWLGVRSRRARQGQAQDNSKRWRQGGKWALLGLLGGGEGIGAWLEPGRKSFLYQ